MLELVLADLQNYSSRDVNTLKQYYKLHSSGQQLLLQIAQENLKNARVTVRGNMLPYDGDKDINAAIQKAMRNQDREALRILMAARRENEAERSRQAIAAQEQRIVPPQASNCSNDADIVTQVEWSPTSLPEIKIDFIDPANPDSHNIVCFTHYSILIWLRNPAHEYRGWYPNTYRIRDNKPLDNTGHGGRPSIVEKFYQLPNRKYIAASSLQEADDIIRYNEFLIAYPILHKKRIGNKNGTFGVSELHGQEPGETIYYLVTPEIREQLFEYFKYDSAIRDLPEPQIANYPDLSFLQQLEQQQRDLPTVDKIDAGEIIDSIENGDAARFADLIVHDNVNIVIQGNTLIRLINQASENDIISHEQRHELISIVLGHDNYNLTAYEAVTIYDIFPDELDRTLEAGADPDLIIEGAHPDTALAEATAISTEAIRELIHHGASTEVPNAESNALHLAVMENNYNVVRLLLDVGADPNPDIQISPLALAALAADTDIRIINDLLATGADPNRLSYPGMDQGSVVIPPLFDVVISGRDEVLEAFLSNSADPNIKDQDGVTPLLVAIRENNKNAVVMLIAAGADVNAYIDSTGNSILDSARQINNSEIIDILVSQGAEARSGAGPMDPALLQLSSIGYHSADNVAIRSDVLSNLFPYDVAPTLTSFLNLIRMPPPGYDEYTEQYRDDAHFLVGQVIGEAVRRFTQEEHHVLRYPEADGYPASYFFFTNFDDLTKYRNQLSPRTQTEALVSNTMTQEQLTELYRDEDVLASLAHYMYKHLN